MIIAYSDFPVLSFARNSMSTCWQFAMHGIHATNCNWLV